MALSTLESANEFFVIYLISNHKNFFVDNLKISCGTSSMAIAAFACELYLKSLIYYNSEDSKLNKNHELYKLYKMLPTEYINELNKNVILFNVPNMDAGFKEINKLFEKCRYFFETKRSVVNYDFLNRIIIALYKMCNRIVGGANGGN